MFWQGDLEQHAKNAFFNGLHPEYQAIVVHKQDDPCVNITQLLIAKCECEENEAQYHRNCHAEYAKAYPPSTSRPPYWTNNTDSHQCRPDNVQQDQSCYCQQDNCNNNNNANVTIHTIQVEPTMQIQAEEDYIPPYVHYNNPVQDQDDVELTFYTEFYTAAIRMADDTEWQESHCFNCKEVRHFWHQCTKLLKEEFQQLMDHPKQRAEKLNKKGGPRVKGGQVPQPVPLMPTLAVAVPQ